MGNIYYCRTDGNNLNSGTGYTSSEAFATIAKAVSVVSPSDIVRIAPGTYYETITLATAGTLGNVISWWGDKEAQYFLDLKPGYIRITGCNSTTGIPAGGNIVNCNAKGYNNFYNLVIDGNTAGVHGIATAQTVTKFYDCIISSSFFGAYGYNLITSLVLIRCFISGGYRSVYFATCYDCFAIGGAACFESCDTYNCVAYGLIGYISFFNATNCSSYGGQYGFVSTVSGNAINCKSYNCSYGFGGTSLNKFIKCKAIGCTWATIGSSAVNKMDISDIKYSQCYLITNNAANQTGTATNSKLECFTDISKLLKIANTLKFDIFEQGWSSDLHSLTVTGVLTPVSAANNDYVIISGYNGSNLYQSIFKDNLIFSSNTLSVGNWVLQANATVLPNEVALNYCYNSAVTGTYTNVGTWSGITTVSTFVPIVFSENYDILGQPRRMGTGTTLDCGAYEYSQVDMEWSTYRTVAPAVKITQAGYNTLTVTTKAGVPKTVGCWVYFSGSTLPQIIAHSSEDILTIASGYTATAVGSALTWEQLSLTFTPKASGFLQLSLYARDTATGSFTIFSDFSL